MAGVTAAPVETMLVTGSGGRIGRALVNRLGARVEAIGLEQEGTPGAAAGTSPGVTCDFNSEESVFRALRTIGKQGGSRLDTVVHLLAPEDADGHDRARHEAITVEGTRWLLEALQDFDVGQFVFLSTVSVHRGGDWETRIDEDAPLAPASCFAQAKLRAEELLRDGLRDVPLVVLRSAEAYDDRCRCSSLASRIAHIHEQRWGARVFPGDPRCGRAMVHRDDLIDALLLALERRDELPADITVLVGEPETVSHDELQRTISGLLHGEEWATRTIPKVWAKAGVWLQDALPGAGAIIRPWMIDHADDHYALNIDRARQLLGWRPRHALRDALARMIATFQNDPASWYRENGLSL